LSPERRFHRDSVGRVDPEFVRVTIRVVAIGLIVLAIGTIALVIAFRAYGDERERSGAAALRTLLAAVAFILVCCLVLLRWSVVRQ
jgi:heme/copper-type cytochrome/quinol oxidase subunit 2